MTERYEMSIGLGVLDHLGLNLYSNVPAVLSEAVANAWDADATEVRVTIDTDQQKIVIKDNGSGMDLEEVNGRFLHVGYRRRDHQPVVTPGLQRHVMGRKGIGKLSLFSIADRIVVETKKGSSRPEGFVLDAGEIKARMSEGAGTYHPTPLPTDAIEPVEGTRITLTNLRRRVTRASIKWLRRRLARRFSVIGREFSFTVVLNDDPIGAEDRDYFRSLEYLWTIGAEGDRFEQQAVNAKRVGRIDGVVNAQQGWTVTGWVGTVDSRRGLDEDVNRLIVLAWGKLVQEDILPATGAAGLFTKYVTGEVRADFLDTDSAPDITTSDRQRMNEDDERYQALVAWVRDEVLRPIGNAWRVWRRETGIRDALMNPAIEAWYSSLSDRSRQFAEDLLGRIAEFPLDNEDDRRDLYRHAILAFERLKLREQLSTFSKRADSPDFGRLQELVTDVDELEAVEYHNIVRGRVEVITLLNALRAEGDRERAVQRFLLQHLWLLDPSWERATTDDALQRDLEATVAPLEADLSATERRGRLYVQYQIAAGKHVVIELKRYGANLRGSQLRASALRYADAVRQRVPSSESIEFVVVVGRPPKEDADVGPLEVPGSTWRWITYDALIESALARYEEFLDTQTGLARLAALLDAL